MDEQIKEHFSELHKATRWTSSIGDQLWVEVFSSLYNPDAETYEEAAASYNSLYSKSSPELGWETAACLYKMLAEMAGLATRLAPNDEWAMQWMLKQSTAQSRLMQLVWNNIIRLHK